MLILLAKPPLSTTYLTTFENLLLNITISRDV